MEKRSITLSGHRTSVALEPEFWAALDERAAARHVPLATLIHEIDEGRGNRGLASAIRVAVIGWSRDPA